MSDLDVSTGSSFRTYSVSVRLFNVRHWRIDGKLISNMFVSVMLLIGACSVHMIKNSLSQSILSCNSDSDGCVHFIFTQQLESILSPGLPKVGGTAWRFQEISCSRNVTFLTDGSRVRFARGSMRAFRSLGRCRV